MSSTVADALGGAWQARLALSASELADFVRADTIAQVEPLCVGVEEIRDAMLADETSS